MMTEENKITPGTEAMEQQEFFEGPTQAEQPNGESLALAQAADQAQDTPADAVELLLPPEPRLAKQKHAKAAKKPPQKEKRGFKYMVRDILSVVISAVLIAVVLKTFVVDSRIVPTGSMIPTIYDGDRVIMLRLPYYLGATPGRQDVVVFAAGAEFGVEEDLLKRVIGLPGDTVEVKDNKVYVNGEALVEPYVNEAPVYQYGPVTVPEDCYFMLGDNRNRSRDSHMWDEPYVPFSSIKGEVVLCYWPLNHFGAVK